MGNNIFTLCKDNLISVHVCAWLDSMVVNQTCEFPDLDFEWNIRNYTCLCNTIQTINSHCGTIVFHWRKNSWDRQAVPLQKHSSSKTLYPTGYYCTLVPANGDKIQNTRILSYCICYCHSWAQACSAVYMESKDTHGPPLGHGPVAFTGRTGTVFDVWWFGHWVTWSGLIRAADIASHLGFAATFSRTLDQGEAHRDHQRSPEHKHLCQDEWRWNRFVIRSLLESQVPLEKPTQYNIVAAKWSQPPAVDFIWSHFWITLRSFAEICWKRQETKNLEG